MLSIALPDSAVWEFGGRLEKGGRSLVVAPQPVGRSPYRSFNVASPTSASTTEMIQKRTTTVDSCQPFCSK